MAGMIGSDNNNHKGDDNDDNDNWGNDKPCALVHSECQDLTVSSSTEFNRACDLYNFVQGNTAYLKDDLTRVGFWCKPNYKQSTLSGSDDIRDEGERQVLL